MFLQEIFSFSKNSKIDDAKCRQEKTNSKIHQMEIFDSEIFSIKFNCFCFEFRFLNSLFVTEFFQDFKNNSVVFAYGLWKN